MNRPMTILDQHIHRFQNLPPFNIHAILPDGESAVPWMEVDASIVAELVFDELNPMPQVESIAADIQKWGRLESLARRVWELAEREFRQWKAKFLVELMHPPASDHHKPGWTEDAKGKPKPPTGDMTKALYRSDPNYRRLSVAVERAEEAYNATHAVLEAFRAKKDMIQKFAKKYREG